MSKKKHPLYSRWLNMINRCYKSYHSHYKYYGAKGVTVAERWHNFENYVEDVENCLENGHLLYEEGWELDKDLNGGMIYSLETCVVLSAKENNKLCVEKQQRKVMAFSNTQEIEFQSLSEASRNLNIRHSSITSCLKRGNRHKATGYYFKYVD
ncbi:hypothetical protein V7146_11535 [Gottfriedia acidiceleris]|uniref:hypothetical protein n=1 Tax=Gottfriedia acidiceleris TaxID=371036 RepID=UPI002FFE8628